MQRLRKAGIGGNVQFAQFPEGNTEENRTQYDAYEEDCEYDEPEVSNTFN